MTIIELWPREAECVLCGEQADGVHGVPMHEGDLVPSSWSGEWAGFDACPRCYLAWERADEALSHKASTRATP